MSILLRLSVVLVTVALCYGAPAPAQEDTDIGDVPVASPQLTQAVEEDVLETAETSWYGGHRGYGGYGGGRGYGGYGRGYGGYGRGYGGYGGRGYGGYGGYGRGYGGYGGRGYGHWG